MKAFFDPAQNGHIPRSYLSRGQMRTPLEIPERTGYIIEGLQGLDIPVEAPRDQGMRAINRVHDLGYLRFLESAHRRWTAGPDDWGDEVMSNVFVRSPNPLRGILAESACYQADGSCPIGAETWDAAYASAQTALAGAGSLLQGAGAAYALCRPPGHHARFDAAGGFCYLNNAAIAAEALRERFPRIAILDPDMHHGQGIQELFYDRADTLYISIHGDPTNFSPVVSGHEDERGAGAGTGYTINMPIPHGSPEPAFFERLNTAMDAIRVYAPDVLIVTLGFDIYEADPQAKVSVSNAGFHRMGGILADVPVPVLVVQEGGYHLESLAENTRQFFSGLLRRG